MREHSRTGTDDPRPMAPNPSESRAGRPDPLAAPGPGRTRNADEQETARIEARLLAIGETQVREMKAREAVRKGRMPWIFHRTPEPARRRWLVPRRYRAPVLAFVAYAVLGSVLGLVLGQRFVWFGEAAYTPVAWVLFLGLLPVSGVLWHVAVRRSHAAQPDGMTWVGRWLGAYPCLVVLTSVMVAVAPWGWAALLGWTLGTQARVEARVSSVDVRTRSRGCPLRASFEFNGATSHGICMEGRLEGALPPVGGTVAVSGSKSWLGLHVQGIQGP